MDINGRKSKFRHVIHNLFANQNRKSNVKNRNFENMICNVNKKENNKQDSLRSMKAEKGRRADKGDRRSQKRK